MALAALKKINNRRHLLPKCDSTAKSTGLQCGNLPVHGRTKCRFHGGATPRGDGWHKPRWPRSSDPRAMEKVDTILRAQAKSAKERDQRLASLSPQLRQRYADWLRSHRPGPTSARRREKEFSRQARDAKALIAAVMARPAPPLRPEAQALADRIATLEAELALATGVKPTGNTIPADPDQQADGDHPGADVDVDNVNTGVFG